MLYIIYKYLYIKLFLIEINFLPKKYAKTKTSKKHKTPAIANPKQGINPGINKEFKTKKAIQKAICITKANLIDIFKSSKDCLHCLNFSNATSHSS